MQVIVGKRPRQLLAALPAVAWGAALLCAGLSNPLMALAACYLLALSLTIIVPALCRHVWGRIECDPQGFTVARAPTLGVFTHRPQRVAWSEVLRVRPVSPFAKRSSAVRFQLDRPNPFWTLRPNKNVVLLPPEAWRDPAFRQAVLAALPAERISPFLLSPAAAAARPASLAHGVHYVMCACLAAVAAAVSVRTAMGWGTSIEAFFLAQFGLCMLPAMAMDEFPDAVPLGATLAASISLWAAVYAFIGFDIAFAAGLMAALAGALVGLALVIRLPSRGGAMPQFLLCLALATAGFGAACFSCPALTPQRLNSASSSWVCFDNPWTPSGDAFAIFDQGKRECWLRWHSETGDPKGQVSIPSAPVRMIVSETGALCFLRPDDNTSHLWFAPRPSGDAKLLAQAPSLHRGASSPNGRLTLIKKMMETKDECVVDGYYLCPLDGSPPRLLSTPIPPGDMRVVSLSDHGVITWLQGRFALDKGGNTVRDSTPLPESGVFPKPGQPFSVWTWDANTNDPPKRIYQAETEWLDWSLAGRDLLRACRVAPGPPPRKEIVEINLSLDQPQATPSSGDLWPRSPSSPLAPSHDKRFSVEDGFLCPIVIRDTTTGVARPLNPSVPFSEMMSASRWSPTANKLLYSVTDLRPHIRRCFVGKRAGNLMAEPTALYLLDLDKQWPLAAK